MFAFLHHKIRYQAFQLQKFLTLPKLIGGSGLLLLIWSSCIWGQIDVVEIGGKSKKPTITAPPLTTGSISLVCNQPDAEVLFDNQSRKTEKGKLVLKAEKGSHKIEVRHPDFETFSQTIKITPGRLEPVNVTLRPNYGYLVLPNIAANTPVKVEVDGKPLPDLQRNLEFRENSLYIKIKPVGDHNVKVLKGTRALYNKPVTIKPEAPKIDLPNPEKATLVVQVEPPVKARIKIDGVFVNETDAKGNLEIAELSPDDPHVVEVENQQFKPYTYTVEPSTKVKTVLKADLDKIIEYFDPFENLEKWDAPPAWKTGSQMLHVTGDKTLGLVKTIGYRTADVSFDFKLGAAGRASWVIRSDEDKKNYYLFSLNAPTPTTASLQAYVCKDGVLKMEKELRIYNPIEKNKWNHMRVKVEGNKISHFLTPSDATDFISIGLYEDSKNLFEFGTIGFATLGNEDFFVAGSFTVCPEIDGCRPEIKAPEPKTVVPPKKGE